MVRDVPVLGLAGPSGAGKSTAAAWLAGLGCAVIDCDALAREITRPGAPALAQLAARFGADILCGGALRRGELARRAFADAAARRDLNAITHPPITALALERMEAAADARAIVLDGAALPESALAPLCDHILIFTAPEALRLQRILQRGGAEQAVRERLAAQREMEFRPPAGIPVTVIDTTEGEAVLQRETEKALAALAGPAAGGACAGGGVCGGQAGAAAVEVPGAV